MPVDNSKPNGFAQLRPLLRKIHNLTVFDESLKNPDGHAPYFYASSSDGFLTVGANFISDALNDSGFV